MTLGVNLLDLEVIFKTFYMLCNKNLLTLSCSANERTEMKLKIYLSEAWMCSEFGYQRPMSNKKGLNATLKIHETGGLHIISASSFTFSTVSS